MKLGKMAVWGLGIALVLLFFMALPNIQTLLKGDSLSAIGGAQVGSSTETASLQSCDGVASISQAYNDFDQYKIGTDPQTTLFILDGNRKGTAIADDSTGTLDVLSKYNAIAGENSSTYFSKVVMVETKCSNEQTTEELSLAGAPTITVINSDGVTKNADGTAEALGADETTNFEVTVKSPANQCSALYGAKISIESDKTYSLDVRVPTMPEANSPDALVFTTNQSGTGNDMDSKKTFMYSGSLCDGEKLDFIVEMDTTSSAVGEDQANLKINWLPLDIDKNEDDYSVIIDVEDEDNNWITLGNTTQFIFTD